MGSHTNRFDFLEDRGLVANVDLEFHDELLADPEISATLDDGLRATEHAGSVLERMQSDVTIPPLDILNEWSRQSMRSRAHVCRALALQLRRNGSSDAVSLLLVPSGNIDGVASRTDVLRLVFEELPMPADVFHGKQFLNSGKTLTVVTASVRFAYGSMKWCEASSRCLKHARNSSI